MSEYENAVRSAGRWRGFTLIELLAVVALIGVFTLVSTSLFRSAMRWAASTQRATGAGRTLTEMTQRLRADVWGAYEVNVGDERTVLLRFVGDRTIVWVVGDDPDTGVRRVQRTAYRSNAQTEQQDWPLGEVSVGFEPAAGGLTAWRSAPEGAASADGAAGRRSLRLMSQLIIESEAGR